MIGTGSGKVPPKKRVAEIDPTKLTEPQLSAQDRADYEEGWRLFNDRQFWAAHEAWEKVWLRVPDDSRIFFQGIIQLAAAFHLALVKKRYGGAVRNFGKAEEKLALFPDHFLRVSIPLLLAALRSARYELDRHGPAQIGHFDPALVPMVRLTPPPRDT